MNQIEVWHDKVSDNKPAWCVSECLSDGTEIKLISTHATNKEAKEKAARVAEKQNLKVVYR